MSRHRGVGLQRIALIERFMSREFIGGDTGNIVVAYRDEVAELEQFEFLGNGPGTQLRFLGDGFHGRIAVLLTEMKDRIENVSRQMADREF